MLVVFASVSRGPVRTKDRLHPVVGPVVARPGSVTHVFSLRSPERPLRLIKQTCNFDVLAKPLSEHGRDCAIPDQVVLVAILELSDAQRWAYAAIPKVRIATR